MKDCLIKESITKEHTLSLNPLYYNLIKRNEKILETRINDEKRKGFNMGDIITFFKNPEKNETLKVIIVDKYLFENFDEMANNLKKEELGFRNQSKDEMIKTYRRIYSLQNEIKFGVEWSHSKLKLCKNERKLNFLYDAGVKNKKIKLSIYKKTNLKGRV